MLGHALGQGRANEGISIYQGDCLKARHFQRKNMLEVVSFMGEAVRSGVLRVRIILRRNRNEIWRDAAMAKGSIATCLSMLGIGVRAKAMVSIFFVGIDRDNIVPQLRDISGNHLAGICVNEDIIFYALLQMKQECLGKKFVSVLKHFSIRTLPRVWQT